ncbi:hypothetical protein A2837_00005 [Candidatus Kaiserbacteria bacterium RIFCSPHIGHO2_01_FULL_46_22]|uniref:Peptidase A24A N-terminal domain-containing protein n=1 Tax=Candidatus Kaiserbacteria bacterium RIFCSPHIGHO2_01_FULL_46_22 TaxID=1798475 RepID=A0A1F6BZ36_9BACT|nr:MAG: hypothetical protein A2837_00005 [Candidatus Kaiserbacteria bacterium RIFCSPHIGHO2_01_FULL_46_22]
MLPEWFFFSVVGLFGLIIGSFLNVVIYRLHTGRSLNDRSHCLSCGHTLSWYELFPVFSYLVLRGRCRSCHSFIPYRYALVEMLTAAAFLAAYLNFRGLTFLILDCVLLSVLIVVLVYDFYHKIILDELSIIIAALALLIVGVETWLVGDHISFLLSIFAGGIATLLLFTLWYFSQGRAIGLGDAKISFGLGMLVGLTGLFSFIVLAFWLGAVFGLILILLSTRRLRQLTLGKMRRVSMKSEVPFAPFLIVSFILVYLFEIDILALVERTLLAIL